MADSKSTADVISQVVDKVGDGLAQIGAAIQSHAPEAWALVVKGNYAIAAAGIITGIVLIVVAIIAAIIAYKVFRFGFKRYEAARQANSRTELGVPFMFVSTVAFIPCAIIFGVGLIGALSAHDLAMLLYPEGTTARDLLLRALN